MNPLALYQQRLLQEGFYADPSQKHAIEQLQSVFEQLTENEKLESNRFSRWLATLGMKKTKPIKGVYLWGEVGAGKTLLMDMFYQALPTHKKRRWHFHKFMQEVHHQLKTLQGQINPIRELAKRLARKNLSVICLDEFLVNDITDAMILANLLEALFAEGITLVTTANLPPSELYRNGLQRARFLPAILLLQENCHLIHVLSQRDYRLRPQKPIGFYFAPLDDYAARAMQETFSHYANTAGIQESLVIGGRNVATIKKEQEVVWFDFGDICTAPRSQLDYLEIVKNFKVVLISNVPQFKAEDKNAISYFIKLVDVFYDARILLVLSAAVPIYELCNTGELAVQFQRTESRLIEMQGEEYLKSTYSSHSITLLPG